MASFSAKISVVGLLIIGFYLIFCSPGFLSGKGGLSYVQAGNINISRSTVSIYQEASPIITRYDGQRPPCKKRYRVLQGDTQWSISERFATQADKHQWIRSMRWVSGKQIGDTRLAIGELLCVGW